MSGNAELTTLRNQGNDMITEAIGFLGFMTLMGALLFAPLFLGGN